MKKLVLGICVLVVLFLVGCASEKMAHVYDSGVPEEQMSFLWIPNYVKVTQFDNTAVEWATPLLVQTIKVGIPSGEFTFIFDTIVQERNLAGIPNLRNQSITKYFEAGKSYQLILQNGQILVLDL